MDVRCDVNVHAHIEILKLRVDQRVNAHASNAGLKRSRRDRHAIADLQRSLLPIKRANLRILDKFGVGVAQQRAGCGRRNSDGKVRRVQIANAVQVDLVGCSRSAGCLGGRSAT